jgi:uncharacterized membrane protein YeiH
MDTVIHVLDLFGTAVFAVTGALAAGRKRMDVFGVVVLGCVTALGGGTLRDVVLGSQPIFWISETRYLQVATVAAIATFFLARRWKMPVMVLMYADALGLAVFTLIGFQKAFHITHAYSIAIVMGMTTGVMGGLIRDVLAGEVPMILRREIYASASLCGAAVLALLTYLEILASVALSCAFLATLVIRVSALRWNLSLPLFRLHEGREVEKR